MRIRTNKQEDGIRTQVLMLMVAFMLVIPPSWAGSLGSSQLRQQDGGVAFLQKLYDRVVLNDLTDPTYEAFYRQHLTPKVRAKLADAYEYDGGGLAWWLFRTGAQDPDMMSMIRYLKIKNIGNGWYSVKLVNYGTPSYVKVKLLKRNNTYLIDGIINPEYQ